MFEFSVDILFLRNHQVDIIPALTDANRTLRSEKEKLEKSLDETREQLNEIEPLRQKVKEIEEKDEKSQNLIKALKTDGYSWKQKALQLTEVNKKLSPEELKRLEGENLRLSKQVTTMQNTIKQQGVQVVKDAKIITDFDKLNLVRLRNSGLVLGSSQFSILSQLPQIVMLTSELAKNLFENNHLDSLAIIRETPLSSIIFVIICQQNVVQIIYIF